MFCSGRNPCRGLGLCDKCHNHHSGMQKHQVGHPTACTCHNSSVQLQHHMHGILWQQVEGSCITCTSCFSSCGYLRSQDVSIIIHACTYIGRLSLLHTDQSYDHSLHHGKSDKWIVVHSIRLEASLYVDNACILECFPCDPANIVIHAWVTCNLVTSL